MHIPYMYIVMNCVFFAEENFNASFMQRNTKYGVFMVNMVVDKIVI